MWSTASLGIEPIYTYAQAVEREESIAHIRGTNKLKPLGKRRNKHVLIRKDDLGNIVCRLYATDVVTFKPSGEIVVFLGGWASHTTSKFITETLGVPFSIYDNQMWVACRGSKQIGHFPIRSQQPNIFRRDGNELVLDDPTRLVTHMVNRKEANNVRRRYKAFRNYTNRMMRLLDDGNGIQISHEQLAHAFGVMQPMGVPDLPPVLEIKTHRKPVVKYFAEFQQLIEEQEGKDKTEDFYKAFVWLVRTTNAQTGKWRVALPHVQTMLEDILFYMHRHEVFIKTEHVGEMKRDTYYRFFSHDE